MKRRVIFWLLILAFVWVVLTRTAEIRSLAKTLAEGVWGWVLAAAILQVLYYVVLTWSYQSAFSAVEVNGRVLDMIPITFAALFLNVVAPSGNVSGMALWADDANRRGQSGARAMAGTLLQLAADFSAFTLVLLVGMGYLFYYRDLQYYEVIGAGVLVAITLGLCGVLLLGLWSPNILKRLLNWIQSASDGLAKRWERQPFLAAEWAERNATEFSDASVAMARYPGRVARTVGIAFIAHLVDLSSLYVIFLAFRTPVDFGVLVAGYAMGILFWIVSPTPQGIGVVEGVMALVFTSLNVSPVVATTVALSFRGLTFWLPLLLGFLILHQVKTFSAGERAVSEAWNVRLVAILTALMGIINVLSAITPALMERVLILESYVPLFVRHGSRLTAALAGFALLVLSVGLWRRKRVAWLATLCVLLVSGVSHMVKGLDYEEALLAGALAIWLLMLRHHFHARSDTPSMQQGLRVLLAAFCFTLGYGVLGFYLLDRHYGAFFSFDDALRQTVVMFTQFYNPGLEPVTGFGRYFASSIYVVAAATCAYAAWMLLRPVFVRQLQTPDQRSRAQAIVETYGRSSLARFVLFEDKAYYFSHGGSVVAYAVKGRVAVALGDVIGPENDVLAAIQEFRAFCQHNDWLPCFYQTLPETVETYRAAGLDAICIGHEAIVELSSFSLQGRVNKSLRSSYNHLLKLGYRLEVHTPPMSEELMAELSEISDEWLTMVHSSEKRFSVGWFDDEYVRSSQVAAVHSPEGWIAAFANIVPEYCRNEAAVDLMRHLNDVEPGTMEFLFVEMFEWARAQGYNTFNLGLCALAGVGETRGDPAIDRVMHFVYEHINQFYNFKGLHEFKNKFCPQWSPRYLVYPGLASLVEVWAAVVQVNSG